MADRLIEFYKQLFEIRKYLIKKGQSRYKCSVTPIKLKEANVLLDKCKLLLSDLNKSQDKKELELITDTYENICSLFSEISSLCTLPSFELKLGKMDFDVKTACSLIPILDDKEDTTKRLIDAVDMYADMISKDSQQLLIKFVLKSRLSEYAKLRHHHDTNNNLTNLSQISHFHLSPYYLKC